MTKQVSKLLYSIKYQFGTLKPNLREAADCVKTVGTISTWVPLITFVIIPTRVVLTNKIHIAYIRPQL